LRIKVHAQHVELDLVALKAVKVEKAPQMIIDEVAAILMAIIE